MLNTAQQRAKKSFHTVTVFIHPVCVFHRKQYFFLYPELLRDAAFVFVTSAVNVDTVLH